MMPGLRKHFTVTFLLAVSLILLSSSSLAPSLFAAESIAPDSRANAQVAVPSFTKVFLPNTIGPGSVSTLTFTIDNTGGENVLDLTFTDSLPADVTIAIPASASTTCADASVDAPDGGDTISLSGGKLNAGGICTVTVNVTSSVPGTHTNTSGALSWNTGSGSSATADLTVATDRPGFTKSFSPGTIEKGQRSRLTFTIDNSANGSTAVTLTFSDNLPPGLVVASPANVTNDCTASLPPFTYTGGTVSAVPGTDLISLTGFAPNAGAVPANSSCTIGVDVLATGIGNPMENTSSELFSATTTNGTPRSSGKAGAVLFVPFDFLRLEKSFIDDPITPGGTGTLEFTIRNFDRGQGVTNIAFEDDLEAALTGLVAVGLPLNDVCGTGSQLAGTGLLSFSGGSLEAEESCTFSVQVQVPGNTTPGLYTNTTTGISGEYGGQSVTGEAAADVLFVEPTPLLTKEFVGDPVGAGDDVVIRFTVTNVSTTSAATDITFLDELTDGSGAFPPDATSGFLPFPVSVTLPTTPCGGGSSLALVSRGTDRQALELTGGNLVANDSCTFDVTVTIPAGFPAGTYTSTTEEVSATVDGATRTGQPASDDLTVIAAPQLSKSFADDPVKPGGIVTLEFTLSHSADSLDDATDITFTDDLSAVLAGLTANLPPTPDPPCGVGSTLTVSAGDTLLTLMDGILEPGEDCTFSVTLNVPVSADAGSYSNTTSGVSASVSGMATTSAPASDALQISGLTFTKEFIGDPVIPGNTLTLRFTVDNVHPTEDATITFFNDNLSAALPGLTATGTAISDDCGGSLSGTTFLFYSGGSVSAGQTCTIEVPVLVPAVAADGTYRNVTSSLSANQGGAVTVDPATDVLTVNSNLLQLNKSFTDDPVLTGGTVTLEFTLANLSSVYDVTDIAFTDDLDAALAGLSAIGGPLSDVCGAGSQLSGTGLLTFANGSLAAGASCAFSIQLQIPAGIAPGTVAVNSTSPVGGLVGALAVTGNVATDELRINFFNLEKEFLGTAVAGGTAALQFTIQSLVSDSSPTAVTFTDDLNATLPGLSAVDLPASDICGPGSLLDGTTLLSLTAPAGNCVISVPVQIPSNAAAGDYENTTSPLLYLDTPAASPATATLTVQPPSANAQGPYSVDEGGAAPITGSVAITVPGLIYAWDLDDNGSFETPGPTATFGAAGLDGPSTVTITLQVTDIGNNVGLAETVMAVRNVTPTIASVTNSGPVGVGDDATIAVVATDPGGVNDPLSYEFDCDNDTLFEIGPQAANSAVCAFSAEGLYAVSVRVTDDEGAFDTGVTNVTVENQEVPVLYVSSSTWGSVDGVHFTDEDILAQNLTTGVWSKYFDASDVWLVWNDLEAFHIQDDGTILMSFAYIRWVWGLGWTFPGDIVRFVPTSLGNQTAGHFERFLDGSDIGLTKKGESIDAISFAPDGRLVVSTIGSARVPGASGNVNAKDEDLLVLNNGVFGSATSGTWEIYFDGSDVGLNTSREDVWAVWVDPDTGEIYLSTRGSFSVSGVSGDGSDIFLCTPSTLGADTTCAFSAFWSGSAHSFGDENIDGIHIGNGDQTGSASLTTGEDSEPDIDDREEDASLEDTDDTTDEIEDVLDTLYLPSINR